MEIRQYNDHEGDFYALMGKFFANRKYAQEMGGWQFYTKDRAAWFLAVEGGEVLGFCSALIEKTHVYFDNFYVLPKHRGRGISNLLSNERLSFTKSLNMEIRVISNNPIQIKKYERDGFIFNGKRGKYSKYKWHPNQNADFGKNGLFEAQPLEPE